MNTVKKAPKALSWEPQRRGRIYCAPACGLGCTHQAYVRANRDAAKLARALGRGWKPKVWENLGWHYKAVSGRGDSELEVYPYQGNTGYWVSLGQRVIEAKTPRALLMGLLQALREEAHRISAMQEAVVAKIHRVKRMGAALRTHGQIELKEPS